MNQLAESTRATINSLKAHSLLSKALANDPKPTPGYLFPEIARLTQSSGTCTAVLSQLLKVITPTGYSATSATSSTLIGQSNSALPGTGATQGQSSTSSAYASSPQVILKALKILRQLGQSGSVEFRIQLARNGKGPLSEVVGYRGSWDEIHGDRLNEDIRTIAEDLIEYMHSNPVQDHEILEARQKWTDRETAVMQNSTQGLPGYSNPDYEDSDSEEDLRRSQSVLQESPSAKANPRRKTEKKREDVASPPLPGFGNPEFEQHNPQAEPTLMSKLFDRIQDLTAPPPPIAMQAAYRQQEQRRQKLFVGEYSMHSPGHSSNNPRNSKDNVGIVMMGTNPFKRTQRVQGLAGGRWVNSATGAIGTGTVQDVYATSRTFLVPRVDHPQFRNTTSAMVYSLAQHIQTNYIRTQQPLAARDETNYRLAVWGVAGEVCEVVLEGIRQETLISVEEPQLLNSENESFGAALGQSPPVVPVITGILRDMVDWIEQETWERRLKYLFVLDALLAHGTTRPEIVACTALPVLVQTLAGSHCQNASQVSILALSRHLTEYIGELLRHPHLRSSRPKDMPAPAVTLPDIMLLDIGA
ncbi:AP-4 complex accessory subunit Tepsin [Linnemannia gamsii]|uniref:AP-4 complex accessory subunit Tepsin n=1 Tax=Linnemannia gamsii TaxID=64522 RepID=A0ABQ7K469_9FUNG|nr:AP-4 complex accessory subunit Tepsin [Linnemannia gamsii]